MGLELFSVRTDWYFLSAKQAFACLFATHCVLHCARICKKIPRVDVIYSLLHSKAAKNLTQTSHRQSAVNMVLLTTSIAAELCVYRKL